ncbi:putative oxidoreductase YdhV [Fundidesulfovibrio magnetotacticus]|uniref:Putative oxidoreductase YdhV n=1 Tax=Fundidesulfovibrio magnetotacticus TaxID=2730080 RepID=A0A6V8LS29_9BACT|nr:aldehyde ferredoxin oxidoreductase [Fundidesulfovibrio magnetotacticus]GFK93128.1 putative oxidoreductase YdhV [Fundidesulfovibrio magnetotacticus]
MTQSPGGFAGRVLRVDLSSGKVSREDTAEKYGDVLGGTGIGYRVLFDEVPAGTGPFDPANKLVFATGALAGTGVPCNGRTAVTAVFPTVWPAPLAGSGHMGGQFAAKLKYAGYDALILEGRADKPVWLFIRDGRVELRDASRLWGGGIRRATLEISQEMGPDCVVAAIGQAGERLAPLAIVANSVSHSAGGVGGVMGSKNLKAVGVQGSGSLRIAGPRDEWERLIKHHLSLLGANNQHVVPAFPSPESEYYNPGSRWVGEPGRRWGAADPPVEITGSILDLNRIAYRSNSAAFFLGEQAWRHTVRGNGCTACPIRCHTVVKMPSVAAKYGIKEVGQNTCVGLVFGRAFFRNMPGGNKGLGSLEACMVGMHLADDYGLWCNYGQLQRDFVKLYSDGTLKARLPAKEYASYDWDKYDAGDPAFLFDLIPRLSERQGELGQVMSQGTAGLFRHWGLKEEDWKRDHSTLYWKMGHPKHHANEDDGQCGVLINTQYNRDAQCHSHTNFVRNGLPIEEQKRLAGGIWGSPDSVDAVGDYRPMNVHKARRARWSLVRKELHDSLGLCNWMGPWVASPLKEQGYRGDDSLESKLFSLATGRATSREELDLMGERIFTLHRALTIRDMGTLAMREKHDLTPDWLYEDKHGQQPFTQGTIRMDRADIATALDMFYGVMGWDKASGAPTRETYARLGLDGAASALERLNLLPGDGNEPGK